jgi:hypothetical protein
LKKLQTQRKTGEITKEVNTRIKENSQWEHQEDSGLRPTNKFKLNAKSLFEPSLKTGKPIVIENDISEGSPGAIGSEAIAKSTLKDLPMKKTTKRQRMTSAVKSPNKNVKENRNRVSAL